MLGVGGIGGVVGGMLAKAGHDVTLVDQWPENVEAIRKNGLTVQTPDATHSVTAKALHLHELQSVAEPFDFAFIAVKSYDTEWATRLAQLYVRPGGAFVSYQNAINDERIAAIVGIENTMGCVITISAGMYEPGVAIRTDNYGMGFKVGELTGKVTPRAERLCEIMQDVGGTKVTDNLMGERWSKLMINSMTNAVAGVTGYSTRKVRSDPQTVAIGIQLGAEAIRVAKANGYTPGVAMGIDPEALVAAAEGRGIEEVVGKINDAGQLNSEAGKPSFLQDVLKGRRTEVEYLNGYVAEKGRAKGVPTPWNDKVVEIVNGLGPGFKSDPKHIEPLIRMLE
jgi:2-dehydropantoate 2-reductase